MIRQDMTLNRLVAYAIIIGSLGICGSIIASTVHVWETPGDLKEFEKQTNDHLKEIDITQASLQNSVNEMKVSLDQIKNTLGIPLGMLNKTNNFSL